MNAHVQTLSDSYTYFIMKSYAWKQKTNMRKKFSESMKQKPTREARQEYNRV
jgi:hypothetical protein